MNGETETTKDAQNDVLEERLNSFLSQLQSEYGILDRLVYKNKNQHRRCSYFQYLLKVRRDLRLLQSVHLEDLLSSCFHVITGKKPRHKVHLLESLKKRKCDGGKHNFLERLLGAARLLSQMVEPMLKAATEISTLLARSFFMGFSLTILALLARLRVLVQQMLVDIISVFNIVSSLSQIKQSVKINQDGIEVFREYYPTNEEIVILECLWETDKFVLLERTQRCEINILEGDLEGDVPLVTSAVQYQSIEIFLGDDEMSSEKADADNAIKEAPAQFKEDMADAVAGPFIDSNEEKQVVEGCMNMEEDNPAIARSPAKNFPPEGGIPAIARSPAKNFPPEGGILASSNSTMTLNPAAIKSVPVRKVAFLSVKGPAPSTGDVTGFNAKQSEMNSGDKNDPLFSLLTGGSLKESLF